MNVLQSTYDELKAERDELAVKAARYDWLRISADISWNGWMTYSMLAATDSERVELDTAIDSAMARSGYEVNHRHSGGDGEALRELHDHIRIVYDAVPNLPVTADTMDAATDALHAFCLLVGIHKVDIDTPSEDAARAGERGVDERD